MSMYTQEQIKAAVLREIYAMDPKDIVTADAKRLPIPGGMQKLIITVVLKTDIGVNEGEHLPAISDRVTYIDTSGECDMEEYEDLMGKWKL